MKKTLLFFTLLTFSLLNAQNVNIPDTYFKAKLLDANTTNSIAKDVNGNDMVIDVNGDNEIQNIEAAAVYVLYIDDSNISNLTGIEAFTALVTLNCKNNQLTNLDVSQNINLGDFDCRNNLLTSLDISHNINLSRIGCNDNLLTSLDVSQNTNLSDLYCSNNQLESLNVKNGVNEYFYEFHATNNPNLFCIEVDNAAWSTTNWTDIDNTTSFSENCLYDTENLFITTWKTDNPGTSNDASITIPTVSGLQYNFYVDWGDNSPIEHFEFNDSATATSHTYNNAGTYTVSISGTFPRIYFNNGGDKDKILSIEQWGNIQWSSMNYAFAGCSNLVVNSVDPDKPDLSAVTDMSYMFYLANSLRGNGHDHFDHWGTSNVTNMRALFWGGDLHSSFNQPLNSWDVSHVRDLAAIVSNTNFNQPVKNWVTSSALDMKGMFGGCQNFNQEVNTWTDDNGITHWDTSNVTILWGMFSGASSFNQPINNWNTSNVTEMRYMFKNATAFNQDINTWTDSNNVTRWDVSKVEVMHSMFRGATSFNRSLNNWDVSQLYNTAGMFKGASSFNGDISTWHTQNLKYIGSDSNTVGGMFQNATSFNQDLGAWDISSVIDGDNMFNNSGMSVCNFDATLEGWSGQQNIPTGITLGAENIHYTNTEAYNALTTTSNWNITGATPLFDETNNPFGPFLAGTNFTLPTPTGNDQGVWTPNINNQVTTTYTYTLNNDNQCITTKEVVIIDPQEAFITTWKTETANETITIPLVSTETYDFYINWDSENTTSYQHITSSSNLTHDYDTPGTYTVSISGTFPRIYFNNGGDKDKILSIEQWGNIEWSSMSSAFYGCSNLVVNSVDPDKPDLSAVTNMSRMFFLANSLRGDGHNHFNHWDTSNVTNMRALFSGDSYLTATTYSSFNQPLNNWDMSNVTDLAAFVDHTDFNQPVNNWITSSVLDMNGIFLACQNFNQDINTWTDSNNVTRWDVSNVTIMRYMFNDAVSFNKSLDNWDVSNVTDMKSMFENAILFNQNISMWNTENVIIMGKTQTGGGMFQNATSFNQNLSTWDISSLENAIDMFNNSGMSVCNFDATLQGWSEQQNIHSDVILGAENIHYTTEAYNALINNYNWTINGAIHEELPETPIIDTSNPITDCTTDENLTLTAVVNQINGTSIVWYNEDNEVVQDPDLPTLTGFGTVTYYAKREKIIDANCTLVSADSTAVTLTINKKPTIQPVENIRSCINATLTEIQFSADVTDTTFEWTATGDDIGLPGTSGTGNIQAFTSTNAGTAQITVKAINNGDCESDEVVFNIDVTPCDLGCIDIINPINGATAVVGTSNISWQAVNGATNYYISIGTTPNGTEIEDNVDTGSNNNYIPQGNWEEGQTYYVTIVAVTLDTNGEILDYTEDNCQEFSFTVQSELFMPNAFTPNNDGINDTYNIKNIEYLYPKYMLYIYDRWGSLVYNGKNGWTGKSNNLRALGAEKVYKGAYYMIVDLGNGETLKQTIMINY